jgi:uncharacterized membrane protein YuzA (DUF378 family)
LWFIHFYILRYYGITKKGGLQGMDRLALLLVIIGALNWLLVGLFQFDLVASIFGGQDALLSRLVYTLVGVAGIWSISLLFRDRGKAEAHNRNKV